MLYKSVTPKRSTVCPCSGVLSAMLQELISKAEGEEAAKEQRNELEELQQLLPDIKEKVEDAKESQRTTAAASFAIQQTMVGHHPKAPSHFSTHAL